MSTLLALPGLLLDRRLFGRQIRALEDEVRIIVPELWHGDDVRTVASSVLAQAPETFALLGLSMGGYVALEIMRQAPGRVTRLALLDTQAAPDEPAVLAAREERIEKAKSGRFDELLDELHPTWLHPDRASDQALRQSLRGMANTVGQDGFVASMRTIMSRPDSRPDLARITCPTLVLCGREDQPTPVEAHLAMARSIPEATLVVLPRCGHLSPLEQPDAVTDQLRLWLTG